VNARITYLDSIGGATGCQQVIPEKLQQLLVEIREIHSRNNTILRQQAWFIYKQRRKWMIFNLCPLIYRACSY